jgi:hypothetical protein
VRLANVVITDFKNSVCTTKKTLHYTITNIDWLMLFKEIIGFCSENRKKEIQNKIPVYKMKGYRLLKRDFIKS